jgi:thiamine biosynthesis lipoprotein
MAIALLAAALAGCQRDQERSTQLYVFGTLVEVKLWGASAAQSDAAFGELQQLFRQLHRDLHAWEPGRLTEVNQAFAAGEAAMADPHIVELVRRSQELESRSGGRFNPAIGGLIGLWGFHTSDYPVTGPPPTRAEIDRILAQRPSSRDIVIDGLQLHSDNPAVQLDFGGIAKGYAVDLAVQHLRARGIENAIVNAGGDLRAVGRHGERPWRVAVRKPGGGVIGAVEVRGDESLFTSGNYERFRLDATERYPHILDPRSGWPVGHVASVTVIAGEGVLADAAATALVVAGLDDWPAVAAALGLEQVLVIDESGQVYLTPEMAQRVRFTEPLEPVVVTLPSGT